MKIEMHKREPGVQRAYVDFHWYRVALPAQVSLSTSFFPTERSTDDVTDGSWLTQRVLNLTVLMLTLRVVVRGPLFTREECE